MAAPDETKWPAKEKPDVSWIQNEEHVIPENRLTIVFCGISCAAFIVALDQAMVSTALPTMVAHFGDANNSTWVGGAYLLGASALGPSYGKLSDMFGRKAVFFASIATFLIGSALCGAAQTMTWLIVCRAVQGLGGKGIMYLAIVIISDIVPLKDRGPYNGCIGAITGVASVAGPLLGGVFAQYVSWRWCFLITLPIGGAAAVVVYVFLNLNPRQGRPFREHLADLDFVGLTFIVLGIVCLLIGLNFGQTNWSDSKAFVPVVVGCVMLISGGINEIFTHRSPIIPPRLFETRTSGIILIASFSHGFVFSGCSYYLPIYYQVLGASATGAGIRMIPYQLGHASTSIISGIVISRTASYRPIIWVAWIVITIGWGLMIMLDNNSSVAEQICIPLIVSLGNGCLLQAPTIAIQASMPLKDMATSSSTVGFLGYNELGGSFGITLGGAIISNVLPTKLAAIPNVDSFNLGSSAGSMIHAINQIPLIQNQRLRKAIINAFSSSISAAWVMFVAVSGFTFVLVLFIRGYSLQRKIVRGGVGKAAGDVEQTVVTPISKEENDIRSVLTSLQIIRLAEQTSSSIAALEEEKD